MTYIFSFSCTLFAKTFSVTQESGWSDKIIIWFWQYCWECLCDFQQPCLCVPGLDTSPQLLTERTPSSNSFFLSGKNGRLHKLDWFYFWLPLCPQSSGEMEEGEHNQLRSTEPLIYLIIISFSTLASLANGFYSGLWMCRHINGKYIANGK